MPASDGPRGPTIKSIERALDVLDLFAETEGHTLGVTEIAQSLDLSKAVVHRILTSFRSKGYVEIDPASRRYRLGPKALYLGLGYMDRVDVRAVALSALEELSKATNETATLSIRTGWTRVYIDQVTPPLDVKMVVQLGHPYPLHAGASSKALLAHLEPREIDEYLSHPLQKLTALTVTSARALRRELDEIRERGYAASAGERLSGAASVAAPVFGSDGDPAGVISVCGPADRFRSKASRAARLLVVATRRVSAQLGYRPAPEGATRRR